MKKTEDLFTTPMTMGATGFANETRTLPVLMNEYLGTKFDVVMGYQGSEEVGLAMERGEVHGKAGTVSNLSSGAEAGWVRDGKLKVLMQVGLQPNPALPDVPNVMSYIKDLTYLRCSASWRRPSRRPSRRRPRRRFPRNVGGLRAGFDAAAADPDFLAEMKKANTVVDPISGLEVETIIDSLYATPAPVLDKIRTLLKSQ